MRGAILLARPIARPGRAVISLKRYDQGIHPTLCYYMALAGLTLAQIAEQLGISDRTMDIWVKVHPELRQAIKPGKDFIDNLVEGSLLKRALGYEVIEVTKERAPVEYKAEGSILIPTRWGMKITKKVTKHIPADAASMIFWMKNRKSWRDRHDFAATIDHHYSLENLSDEELMQFRALALKAEAPVAGRN